MTRLVPPPFRRTGIIAGNFDVIHPGYSRLFKDAKENACDKLVIALHVDPTIERPNKAKPILSAEERTEILLSLRYIDNVLYYNTENELFDLLKSVSDHIRIIGTDYENKDFTGKNLASSIYYHKRDHNWSTTRYKTEIAKQCLEQGLLTKT
jgi:glycerol-3-phosphate cytidylyltransferase